MSILFLLQPPDFFLSKGGDEETKEGACFFLLFLGRRGRCKEVFRKPDYLVGGAMSKVWMCSDLHLYHKNILKFRDWCGDDNEKFIAEMWKATVSPRDIVYMLGDILFSWDSLVLLEHLPGRKVLICGNHDNALTIKEANERREAGIVNGVYRVHGFITYKNTWLSHAPIHPASLRGKINLHGHIHKDVDLGLEYVNINADVLFPKTGSVFFDFLEFRDKYCDPKKRCWRMDER